MNKKTPEHVSLHLEIYLSFTDVNSRSSWAQTLICSICSDMTRFYSMPMWNILKSANANNTLGYYVTSKINLQVSYLYLTQWAWIMSSPLEDLLAELSKWLSGSKSECVSEYYGGWVGEWVLGGGRDGEFWGGGIMTQISGRYERCLGVNAYLDEYWAGYYLVV